MLCPVGLMKVVNTPRNDQNDDDARAPCPDYRANHNCMCYGGFTVKAPGRPVIVSSLRSIGIGGDGTPDLPQLVLTGVSAADSVVNLFDGLTLLGSAAADASGIWRFTIDAFWTRPTASRL